MVSYDTWPLPIAFTIRSSHVITLLETVDQRDGRRSGRERLTFQALRTLYMCDLPP
jgi:hypothetical protein